MSVKTKLAKGKVIFCLSSDQYANLSEWNGGFCIGCEAEAYGMEPDARNYTCENCGQPSVFGAEELLMRDQIEIID